MSLISSFVTGKLLKELETEFNNHAPEMQAFLLHEVQVFVAECAKWLEEKISNKSKV